MTKKPLLLLALVVTVFMLGLSLSYFLSKPAKLAQVVEEVDPQTKGVVASQSSALPGESDTGTLVTKVIDGDTVEIEGGQRVRYIGIDTPETVHPNIKTECFGAAASAKNKDLVEGKRVILKKDVSEVDKYGRLLRYVYLGDIFVNEYLVREGFASASSYPPDIKYQQQFSQAEQEARENNRGLWKDCVQGTGEKMSSDGCDIKGNISTSGEKIYHTPSQKYYAKTVIDESRGEKYFCTEEEAQNAGFRKSKT